MDFFSLFILCVVIVSTLQIAGTKVGTAISSRAEKAVLCTTAKWGRR